MNDIEIKRAEEMGERIKESFKKHFCVIFTMKGERVGEYKDNLNASYQVIYNDFVETFGFNIYVNDLYITTIYFDSIEE